MKIYSAANAETLNFKAGGKQASQNYTLGLNSKTVTVKGSIRIQLLKYDQLA